MEFAVAVGQPLQADLAGGTTQIDQEEYTMNKTELVETIAQRTDIAKKDVQAVLDTFEDIVGGIVAEGKQVLTIPGFLKFEQTKRAARTGRNPQTGETIQVPATNAAKVTAGAKLKARAKSGN